jgi:hypothetical protein
MNRMVIRNLQRQLKLEVDRQSPKGKTEDNHENGRELQKPHIRI